MQPPSAKPLPTCNPTPLRTRNQKQGRGAFWSVRPCWLPPRRSREPGRREGYRWHPGDTQVLFRVQPRTQGPASGAAAGTALRAGDRGHRAGRWSWAVARGRGCCPARPRAPSHVWLSGTLHCTASRLLSLEASPLPSQHSRPSRSPGDRLASPPRSSALSTGSLLSVFLFFGKKRWAFFP